MPITRTIPIESETTTVEANYETVKKFQKYNNWKYIDCIAYAISKVSDNKIQGLELFIIPIVEFEKYVQPDKKLGMFYRELLITIITTMQNIVIKLMN